MTDFTKIDSRSQKFRLIFQRKDFGRVQDLVIAIVPRWPENGEAIAATIAPFGLLAPSDAALIPPTLGGAHDDGLGAEALVQAFMDYGWEHGFRPTEYRKMQHGSVRWHLRAIWRLLWGVPK